jgi:hypothetical protein
VTPTLLSAADAPYLSRLRRRDGDLRLRTIESSQDLRALRAT